MGLTNKRTKTQSLEDFKSELASVVEVTPGCATRVSG